MIDTVYVEDDAWQHTRTRQILARYPRARVIEISHYGELLNPRSQNFRLQKQHPSLILAVKHNQYLHPAPSHYAIGGEHNFYFSHMINCLYDCRYCFLQGMFQSANYVVFVNYEDFFQAIAKKTEEIAPDPVWFFSGYDCDSLAYEPVTQFADRALDAFANMPKAQLELRTKSTQIRHLLKRSALPNCVVAFSLSPETLVGALEHKTPTLEKRLRAAASLAQNGWLIGWRFDPVIAVDNYEKLYRELFDKAASAIPEYALHSISMGPFRLPKPFYKRLVQLYPEEPLLADRVSTRDSLVAADQESKILQFCENEILQRFAAGKYFPCVEVEQP